MYIINVGQHYIYKNRDYLKCFQMILTYVMMVRDDMADHERWSKRLSCDRILHSLDVPFTFLPCNISLYFFTYLHLYLSREVVVNPTQGCPIFGLIIRNFDGDLLQ